MTLLVSLELIHWPYNSIVICNAKESGNQKLQCKHSVLNVTYCNSKKENVSINQQSPIFIKNYLQLKSCVTEQRPIVDKIGKLTKNLYRKATKASVALFDTIILHSAPIPNDNILSKAPLSLYYATFPMATQYHFTVL